MTAKMIGSGSDFGYIYWQIGLLYLTLYLKGYECTPNYLRQVYCENFSTEVPPEKLNTNTVPSIGFSSI
jgi:hypothetical protein